MTKVVTFYSYKGGVGRTMALVNTAHVLARKGYRVLMVDLDLEAPGMTHFFADQVRAQATSESKDALDLLLDVKRTLPTALTSKRVYRRVSLEPYVISIALPTAWNTGELSPYTRGRLDLLPATLDAKEALSPEPSRGYLERMDALDLPGIFAPDGPGHRFGDHLRKRFTHARFIAPGDRVLTLRDEVQASYDLVLVDSRTGLNESSGLCIGPLSDALVICTGLNQQNFEGTRYFMTKAGLLDEEGRHKPYALVVGPVPPWNTQAVDERLREIEDALKVEAVTIPYHPAAALTEPVFVLDEPDEAISVAYADLAEDIEALVAPEGIEALVGRQLLRSFKTGEQKGYEKALAKWLPAMRLRQSYDVSPALCLHQCPSALTLSAVCVEPLPLWDRPRAVESYLAAASVAALRLGSSAPFERVAALVFERSAAESRVHWAAYLTFFQLRVGQPLFPEGDLLDCLVKEASVEASQHWFSMGWNASVALALAAESGELPASARAEEALGALCQWSDSVASMLSNVALGDWVPPGVRGIVSTFLEFPGQAWILAELAEELRTKLLEQLESAGDYMQELLQLARHRVTADATTGYFLPGGGVEPLLGLWPDAQMVSILALVKGPDAIDEILEAIRLCRLVRGYAWRLFVDFRHLRAVKDHPKFIAFLAEEEAWVDKVEAAIDRGRYPL